MNRDPRYSVACRSVARRRPVGVALLLACLSGCAAFTNPVRDGIPAEALPDELKCPSKEDEFPLPLTLLSQPPPDSYRLGAGDVLGVYVEGILDEKTLPGPIPTVRVSEKTRRAPERGDLTSALGYPIDVRGDGTVSLPLLKPLPVKHLTVEGAEQAIRNAYVDAKLLQPGKKHIFVSLLHKRQVQVLVFRRDLPGQLFDNVPATRVGLFGSGAELIGKGTTGAGFEIFLPAYENDLLHALALTGGFPGTNASRRILIFRDVSRMAIRAPAVKAMLGPPGKVAPGTLDKLAPPGGTVAQAAASKASQAGEKPGGLATTAVAPVAAQEALPQPRAHATTVLSVPLRLRPGEPLEFAPEEIILQHGDVVLVEAAPIETFYTGGLLPPGEHILPRDYDLDVVEAVMRVRGPFVNGAFGGSNLSGVLLNPGIGNPSPRGLTVIRRTPDGGQVSILVDLHRALVDAQSRILVQPGDVLILQETPWQAFVRYVTQQYNFLSVFKVFNQRDALGVMSISVP